MKIQTGHSFLKNVQEVNSDQVRFISDDGNAMFEVRIGKDGKSIEITGITETKHDDVLYGHFLTIEPKSSNRVVVRTLPY